MDSTEKPIPEEGLDALKLLEWFAAHEDEFPKDPDAILRHVGIVVAKNMGKTEDFLYHQEHMHDNGSPIPSESWRPKMDLAEDFQNATAGGERNIVEFDPDCAMMSRPSGKPACKDGWTLRSLERQRASDSSNLYTAKYSFSGQRSRGWREWVTISVNPSDEYDVPSQYCAQFCINKIAIFWYHYHKKEIFCLAPVDYDDPVHAVCVEPWYVKYVIYNNKRAIRVGTYLHSCKHGFVSRRVTVVRFTEENKPFQYKDMGHFYEGFNPWVAACPWTNETGGIEIREIFEIWRVHFRDLEMLFGFMGPWPKSDLTWRRCYENGPEYRKLDHCGRFLCNQLWNRINRIVRVTLLARAQALEEERAQDPVKRCAACAVQAAKDQIVLGLEPAKRQKT